LSAALLSGAALVLAPSVAAARAEASFALKPVTFDPALDATKSYFIVAVKPGEIVRNQVRVVNTGGKTGTAFLYPVDATTGQTSGAVYLARQAARRDAGGWITIARRRVTLAPGAATVVPFTVHVPPGAGPGDHLGAIVAENAEVQKPSGRGALRIRIKHLTIDAVELQLPGLAVSRVVPTAVRAGGEHGYQYLYVHLKSTGTVLVKPALTLAVRNDAGRVVARRSLQLDTFVPGTAIDYPALLPSRVLGPGRYTAEVRLHSSADRVLSYRKTEGHFDVTRTFSFTVSSGEHTKVFSGVAPVAPTEKQATSGASRSSFLFVLAGALGALLAAVPIFVVALRRWPRR
jgi:hypothetical protein